jgi:quinol monooxygenase YgiN
MNTSPPMGPSPCLHHIVMWKLKDPDQAPVFRQLLLSCAELVPGMLAFDVGIRQADLEANVDVVLNSRFADAAVLQAYVTHPHHQAVAAQLGLMREQRHVLDYWA